MTTSLVEQRERQAELESENMDRGVGFFGLMWSSVGSLIGSGWLFGALSTVTIAGPSALIGWGIATIIVVILALIHAELGGLFPVSGGTSRFPHYAFGSLAGGTFGWFSYIQAATVAPIEVLAVIQYASSYDWAKSWYNGTSLHGPGIPIALALLAVAVVINIIGIRWFARINNVLTSWKVLIPVLTIIVLMIFHFHGSNFSAAGGFFVSKGGSIHNILVAIPLGGIVFSLLGFEQAVQLGSEARNPKDIPRAVISAIAIGATIYILVQIAFIGAIQPSLLAKAGTWTNLGPTNHNSTVAALNAAPFYTVAKLAGVTWLAVVLRLDAAISPGGTALIYETSTARLSFGLSKNGYIPAIFARIWERTKVPAIGVIISGLIGVLFLLPFPSWNKLVGVVTDASVMMYAGAPLALGALRLQKPDLPRLYKIPFGSVMAPVGFILANLVIYFTGWSIYSTLMITLLIGYALMLLSAGFRLNPNQASIDWRPGMFVFPYMIGMGLISYFGNFGAGGILDGIGVFKNVLVGGNGDIPNFWDFLIVAAFSLGIYYMALHNRLRPEQVDHNVRDVYPPPMPEH
jgi:amino acid transporter